MHWLVSQTVRGDGDRATFGTRSTWAGATCLRWLCPAVAPVLLAWHFPCSCPLSGSFFRLWKTKETDGRAGGRSRVGLKSNNESAESGHATVAATATVAVAVPNGTRLRHLHWNPSQEGWGKGQNEINKKEAKEHRESRAIQCQGCGVRCGSRSAKDRESTLKKRAARLRLIIKRALGLI